MCEKQGREREEGWLTRTRPRGCSMLKGNCGTCSVSKERFLCGNFWGGHERAVAFLVGGGLRGVGG